MYMCPNIMVQGNGNTRKYKVQWQGGADNGKESKWLEKNAVEQTLKSLAVKSNHRKFGLGLWWFRDPNKKTFWGEFPVSTINLF